jgi:rhamnosyltransferase
MEKIKKNKVGAVIIYYNPSAENLASTLNNLEVVDFVVVVVNGPWDVRYEGISERDGIRVVTLDQNKGIATATNIGLDLLREIDDFSHFVLLDQDTSLPSDYRKLLELEAGLLAGGSDPGIISPCYFNPRTGRISACLIFKKFSFRRFVPSKPLQECTCPIASGSLIRAEVLRRAGRMKDDFFIDYVDNEFGLRLYSLGFQNFVSADVKMAHELGAPTPRKILGLNIRPTNHSPIRKYYITRNRFVVVAQYLSLFPSLVFFEFLAISLDCFRVVFFEKQRMKKVQMIGCGLRDFLLGRMGEKSS